MSLSSAGQGTGATQGSSAPAGPIRAAIVDVDDTIYPQSAWLDLVWRDVATFAADLFSADAPALLAALRTETAAGSDRGGLVDRALATIGRQDIPVAELVARFHAFRPARLLPYPGALDALRHLAAQLPCGVALLSDGEPVSQAAKIAALHLELEHVLILSDEYGREHRKPDPLPFRSALHALGVPARSAVMIGDRPSKDIAGARACGIPAIRVRTGEYAHQPTGPAWLDVPDLPAAARAVLAHNEQIDHPG